MFISEISKEDLRELPLLQFKGNIHVIERYGVGETVARRLRSCPVLGFDTETRPSFSRGRINRVALLQLATESDAYLFRLCKMDIPKNLLALLADPNILKIGAAITNDISTLRRSVKIKPGGFIDLQEMVQQFDIKSIGLSKMAGIVLGHRISKAQQLSNWENQTLTFAQQRYAATDAWICNMIYEKLNSLKIILETDNAIF
jgi:ribonuclease D